MDPSSVASTLDNLDQRVLLLTAMLMCLLIAVTISFAVAGCKSLQEKRSRCLPPSLKSPAEESCKNKGELVLHNRSTSGYAVITYLSRDELINCASCKTITPVKTVSMDKGELVVS